MVRGIVLALVLLIVADLCFNHSALTQAFIAKVAGFAVASSETVGGSVYRR